MKKILHPFSFIFFWKKLSPTKQRYFQVSIIVALIVLIPLAIAIHESANKAEAAWYDDNFGYRQIVAITNGGTAQTNFQVSLTLDTATLITAGKMQADCDDIRITDLNGKVLPHWIEKLASSSCNSATTVIWTKAPSLPTSGATLYVYYGNPIATNQQSGTNVFEVFDDFESYTIGTTIPNWTESLGNWAVESPSGKSKAVRLTASAGEGILMRNTTYAGARVTEADISDETFASNDPHPGIIVGYTDNSNRNAVYWRSGSNELVRWNSGSATTINGSLSGASVNTYYKMKVAVDGAGAVTNASFLSYNSNPSFTAGQVNGIGLWSHNGNDANGWIDNFRVRKYAATEPSVAAPASEEKSPAPVSYWKFDEGTGTVANDTASSRKNGTLSGSTLPTWQTEDQCISGKCLFFNGTTSFVNVGSTSSFSSGNFTLASWFKVPAGTDFSTTARIMSNYLDGSNSNTFWGLYLDSTEKAAVFIRDSSGNTNSVTSTSTYADGKWHYISATRSSNTLTLYIDGISVGTATATVGSVDSNRNIYIGADFGTGSGTISYFKGSLDEPKLYNYARSAVQIQADYNAKGSGKGSGAAFGSSNNQASALSNGLVGYWKMDETTSPSLDSSGNGNSGTWTGNAASGSGKFGFGLALDGNGDYDSVADSSSLDVSGAITLSAWVKTSSTTDFSGIISKFGANNSAYQLSFHSGGGVRADFGNSSSYISPKYTATDLRDGKWHLIVATYDGTTAKIYVDTVLGGIVDTGVGYVTTNNNALLIGSDPCCGPRFLNGSIDEARVYNRALSPAEITQLYNFAPGPVGWWKMDEKTGTTANDASGYAHSGTLTNSPNWGGGKYGSAVSLNGTNQYIAVSDPGTASIFDLNGASLTVEAWAKPTIVDGGFRWIIGKDNGGNADTDYLLGITSTNKFRFITRALSNDLTGTTTPIINTWYHVVGVQDAINNKVYLYVNGVLEASATLAGSTTVNNDNISIGARNQGSQQYFGGTIDDFKIYNYARTPSQVIEDLNAGHPAPGSPVSTPLGYWKFDEGFGTTANNSGSQEQAVKGTLTNMASPATTTSGWSQVGRFSKALSFDGINDYVSVPNESTFDFTGASATISFWFKTSSSTAQFPISKYDCSSGGWTVDINNQVANKLSATIRSTTGTNVVLRTTSSSVNDGNWHHASIVYDWTVPSANIYLDGKLDQGSQTGSGTIGYNNQQVLIGARCSTQDYFNGSMDEVKVYGQTLTADQIKLDMNRGAAQVLGALSDTSALTGGSVGSSSASAEYCVPGDSTSCAAPVGRWDFEEGTGTSANDSSGNANTGTLTNGPNWKSGKIGKSIDFDGTNDLVDVGNISNFSGLSSGTVEGWFKLDILNNPTTDASQSIIGYSEGSGTTNLFLIDVVSDGSMRVLIRSGSNVLDASTAVGTIAINNWYHFAYTTSASGNAFYINGVKKTLSYSVGSSSTQAFYSNVTSPTYNWIGSSRWSGGQRRMVDGQIDQMRVFNYSRSASQVAWDYNKGLPIAYWKMDECQGTTANDSSGNGLTGTITIGASGTQTSAGTCATASTAWGNGATGKKNYSLNFDNTDDYVTFGNPTNLQITDALTVQAWVKFTTIPTSDEDDIVAKTDGGGYGIIANESNNGLLATYFFIGGSYRKASVPLTSLSANTWYHVVGTFDGSTTSLYLNGQLRSTVSAAGTISNPSNISLLIGANPSTGSSVDAATYFNGQIDDVKIFNYALSASQVRSGYNNGAVNFGPVTGAP